MTHPHRRPSRADVSARRGTLAVLAALSLAASAATQPRKGPPAADEAAAVRALEKLGGTARYAPPRDGLSRKEMVREPDRLKEGGVRGVTFEGPRLTNAELKAAVKHLAGLPRLQSLTFTNTAVTDDGLKALADLKRLQSIEVGPGKITGT